jgi:zinc and cadmium transporter
MASIFDVLIFSLIGGALSLIGGIILVSNKKISKKFALYATPFAAGALLAAAFIDLLPEATHHGSVDNAMLFTLIGILAFFVIERFLHWFHHHHDNDSEKKDVKIPLIIFGDTVHNFVDGIAIAAGFLVDPSTGIIVTLAVALHEIPQEIADFGLLIKKGMKKNKVIAVNIISSLATVVAALLFFQLGQGYEIPLEAILGLVAGFFIYIAVSDIIPSIHKSEGNKIAGPQTIMLIFGVLTVGLLTNYLHQYIDTGNDHEESSITEQYHSEEGEEHTHEDDK